VSTTVYAECSSATKFAPKKMRADGAGLVDRERTKTESVQLNGDWTNIASSILNNQLINWYNKARATFIIDSSSSWKAKANQISSFFAFVLPLIGPAPLI
jgi:hypothetical protein